MTTAFEVTRERLIPLVSRSFTLFIKLLPVKVKAQVGNFYLLCRYADTIEDSRLTRVQKKKYFKDFLRCVTQNDAEGIMTLGNNIHAAIEKEQDAELVRSAQDVVWEFNSFSATDKAIGLHWLTEMCQGMEKFSKKKIKSFEDLDEYCYFVAGTVGLYLTELFIEAYQVPNKDEMMEKAKNFGLLLQKVNIVRDFSHDFSEGRVFWPTTLFQKHNIALTTVLSNKEAARMQILEEMVEDARKHVKYAQEYVTMLPNAQLKIACSIPLLMALPTLDMCENNEAIFDATATVKINKDKTFTILEKLKKEYPSTD